MNVVDLIDSDITYILFMIMFMWLCIYLVLSERT